MRRAVSFRCKTDPTTLACHFTKGSSVTWLRSHRAKLVEVELVRLVEGGDENVGLRGVSLEMRAVGSEKRIRGGESGPLVAVDERMVLGETFRERGSFLDQSA